jgi:rare lipoprotein A
MRFANKKILMLAMCASLSACGALGKSQTAATAAAVAPTGPLLSDDPAAIGEPYMIAGVTYTPQDNPTYDDVGFARIVSTEEPAPTLANGELFNPSSVSASHRTLPVPSYVEVTTLDNGRTILVRINNRGPMAGDSFIELSPAAAKQLGIESQELTAVRVRRVNPPEQEKAVLREGATATERLATPESLLRVLRNKIASQRRSVAIVPKPDMVEVEKAEAKPAKIAVLDSGKPPIKVKEKAAAKPKVAGKTNGNYVVQLAAFSDQKRADEMARKYGGTAFSGGSDKLYRVRLGPFATKSEAETSLKNARTKGLSGGQILRN